MSSLDENLPFYAPISRAPTKYNPFRPGYKQEDIDPQPLIEAVYNLLGAETVRARLLGRGFFNVVYEFDMKTGPPLVSRIQWNFKADPVLSTWVVEKMTREVAVLELLQRVSPQVPAPRVLAFDFAFNNSVGAPFTIMNRLYGEDLWMAWPTLSADDRITFVKSLASYFAFLIIRSLEIREILQDDPSMLVPVLVHVDMNNRNIMVKDATVSGILDWEIHSSLPACLGATYPDFMRYDATYHPKYGIQPRLMPTKECWPSEEEAATLRHVFREATGVLSSDFVRALEKGETLRQLLELVSCSKSSTDGMLALFAWEEEMAKRRVV
ncbi:kinase-like domain-containing protein [Hysterangium stoloniferum]|nr:kinase-like domain-containing protein [Hysterangium stoloniferum]